MWPRARVHMFGLSSALAASTLLRGAAYTYVLTYGRAGKVHASSDPDRAIDIPWPTYAS